MRHLEMTFTARSTKGGGATPPSPSLLAPVVPPRLFTEVFIFPGAHLVSTGLGFPKDQPFMLPAIFLS